MTEGRRYGDKGDESLIGVIKGIEDLTGVKLRTSKQIIEHQIKMNSTGAEFFSNN